MTRRCLVMGALLFGAVLLFTSCAGVSVKPSTANFKDPVISLASFMVPQYDGFWFYSKKTKPAMGKAGNHGAPLPMTFLFNIENPNPYPVLLEGFQFTVAFDNDFSLVTVHSDDAIWIPAGKTNQVRATTLITVRSAHLSLLVTGGYKLKERGWSAVQALERWWTGVPELSVPVLVHEGAFTFSADGVTKTIPYKTLIPTA